MMSHVCPTEKHLGCDVVCLFFLAGLFGYPQFLSYLAQSYTVFSLQLITFDLNGILWGSRTGCFSDEENEAR